MSTKTTRNGDGITATECAALAGISIGAFRTRCYRGNGPAGAYGSGARTLYPFEAVADWLWPILTAPPDLIDQVLAQCVDVAGCWVFTGYTSKGGYGLIHVPGSAGRMVQTHRVTYEHFVGAIPDGLEPDHLCRVRACCNPWHLEPVTHAVNVQRGLTGGPAVRRRLPRCPCGREYDRIYRTANGGINRQCSVCRAAYGQTYRKRVAVA